MGVKLSTLIDLIGAIDRVWHADITSKQFSSSLVDLRMLQHELQRQLDMPVEVKADS